ncbi:MAG TPA: exonuclease SbcCD subunit D [Frankiaceae bacterium]|nr:exonuclease SbcCD subunit D [Frankiaceae bacterium]
MRLLHTSDWHLGRSLHRADLREAQAAFLDALVATVRSERVDLVLVCGDVYDRAVPSLDAVQLCEDALVRLRDAGARVVVISGNHDSATRLGFSSTLVDASGVHLRTDPARVGAPVLLSDASGEVGVYALPYLEPESARVLLPADPLAPQEPIGRGHAGVLARAMACVRADREARGLSRAVVMGHAWVAGGAASESERDISVGGVGQVGAGLFDDVDYVALGHLHAPQTLSERVRYSGSPLAYSFGEAAQRKGSWLVELAGAGQVSSEFVPAPTPRQLSSVRGRLEELLNDPGLTAVEDHYLSVVLTDPGRPADPMSRLRRRFSHVLLLDHQPEGAVTLPGSYRTRLAGRDDLSVARDFVTHVRGTAPDPDEDRLLAEAFDVLGQRSREVA